MNLVTIVLIIIIRTIPLLTTKKLKIKILLENSKFKLETTKYVVFSYLKKKMKNKDKEEKIMETLQSL